MSQAIVVLHSDRELPVALLLLLILSFGCTERVTTSPTSTSPAASCTYEIATANPCSFCTANSQDHSLAATSGRVSVNTAASCEWTASSDADWLTFSPSNGAGAGLITYVVPANTGPRRIATLRIANRSYSIVQLGVDTYSVSPTRLTVAASGQTGTISVTVRAAGPVPWTATSNSSWLIITDGSRGDRDGTIAFRADANSSASERSATITVVGQSGTVVGTSTVAQAGR